MTGRNDPCPCGSGKKYKQCHGAAGGELVPAEDVAWRRLRRATEGFPTMMLRFVRSVYEEDALHEAWNEFLVWPEDEVLFDPESVHVPVFMPWFFHRWSPDSAETVIADAALHGRSPTSVLLERRGTRLDPVLRRYLEGCVNAPFSFYEVLQTEPGRGFRARDVMTHAECFVFDDSASRMARAGDTIFAQVVDTEGITLLEACGTCLIAPNYRVDILDLRARMAMRSGRVTREMLDDWSIELRDLYLELHDAIAYPALPQLQNTDGDDLVPHRLVYDVESAEAAFVALKHLAENMSEEEMRESAVHDATGTLVRVSFTWVVRGNRVHSEWTNTVLGHVDIDGQRLTARVNSAERAARLKEIITQSLGERARYRATEIQNLEHMMAEANVAEDDSDHEDEDTPEFVAERDALLASHYESWITAAIPALGDITPLEAVRDPHGRERVRALVEGIERNGRSMRPPADPAIVRRMKERLGLV